MEMVWERLELVSNTIRFDAEMTHQFFPNMYEMGSCLSHTMIVELPDELTLPLTQEPTILVTEDVPTPISYSVKFLFSNYTLSLDTTVPLFENVALSLVNNNNMYAIKVVFNADDVMDYYIEHECLFILVDTTMDAARGKDMTSFLIPCSLAFTRICVVKPKSLPPLLFSKRT